MNGIILPYPQKQERVYTTHSNKQTIFDKIKFYCIYLYNLNLLQNEGVATHLVRDSFFHATQNPIPLTQLRVWDIKKNTFHAFTSTRTWYLQQD